MSDVIEAIQLVATDALIEELLSRFDHAIFGAQRETAHNPDRLVVYRRYMGDYATAIGLCSLVLRKVSDDYEECWADSSEKDDDA